MHCLDYFLKQVSLTKILSRAHQGSHAAPHVSHEKNNKKRPPPGYGAVDVGDVILKTVCSIGKEMRGSSVCVCVCAYLRIGPTILASEKSRYQFCCHSTWKTTFLLTPQCHARDSPRSKTATFLPMPNYQIITFFNSRASECLLCSFLSLVSCLHNATDLDVTRPDQTLAVLVRHTRTT